MVEPAALAARLRGEILLLDGAMGTQLIARGLERGEAPEGWNLAHPERVRAAHGRYVEAGAELLTFHVEASEDPAALCERIRGLGARPGVALRPGTPLDGLEGALRAADLVLVMTVEPGFGGQRFMTAQLSKLERVFELVGGEAEIEVDGGLDADTVVACAGAGANAVVAGSYVFGAEDVAVPIAALREGWRRGAARRGG